MKVLALIFWAVGPFNSMVPLEASKVPVLLIVPAICRLAPITVSVAPGKMNRLLMVATPPDKTGWLGVPPGMYTLGQEREGTWLSDQLAAVFQSLLTVPVHRLWMPTSPAVEYTLPHPLLMTALYKVGTVTFVAFSVVVILGIGLHVVPPSVEDSQPT